MKNKLLVAIMALSSLQIFTSCEEEKTAMPEVTLSELGLENSKIGYIGADLHIEADVLANGLIESIKVEIHSESDVDGWELDELFTDAKGLKNTTLHEHVEISLDADTGHYHFHLVVTDQEGQQAVVEEELEIQEPQDKQAPVIVITSAPANAQIFNNGDKISISGTVSDDIKLGGMYIGLVQVNQGLTDTEVNAKNTITLLHTHDFDSYTCHNFSTDITVGATMDKNIEPKDINGDLDWQSGEYYLLVKSKDAFAGNWGFSEKYPISINLN